MKVFLLGASDAHYVSAPFDGAAALLTAILIVIVLFVFAAASAVALGELLLFTPDDEGDE